MEYEYWLNKYNKALFNMKEHLNFKGYLIEVAAQHPLKDFLYPNDEFKKRLDIAFNIYTELKESENNGPIKIYVPGSRHMYNGIPDKISLSQAGCKYLKEKGVSEDDLLGEEFNDLFKGAEGVYNSTDECFVASKIFESQQFAHIYSICSPAQLMRKALSYIQFEVIPDMYSAPCQNMHHNYIDEIFKHIPILLNDERALQGDSPTAKELRQLRNPDLK